jgi:hypothetical protein
MKNKGQIIEWLKERKQQSEKQKTDNRMAKRSFLSFSHSIICPLFFTLIFSFF